MEAKQKLGTGEIVRKGLVMILSYVQGVRKSYDGIEGMRTSPFTVFFELSDSHPTKGKALYYSLGYSVTEKTSKKYDLLDVLEMRAHEHETEASREFIRQFDTFLLETFPGCESMRAELIDTGTAKRIYRWWLPVFEVIRFATCGDPDGPAPRYEENNQ